MSGPLQLRPTAWRARWRPGLQAQLREDVLDNRLFEDRRYELQLAAPNLPLMNARNWPLCTGLSYEQLRPVVRRGFPVMGLNLATGFGT